MPSSLQSLIEGGALVYATELVGKGWPDGSVVDALRLKFPDADFADRIDIQVIAERAIAAARELMAGSLGGGLDPGHVPENPTVPQGSWEGTILVTWPDPRTGRGHRETARITWDHEPNARDIGEEGYRLLNIRATQYGFDASGIEPETILIALTRG